MPKSYDYNQLIQGISFVGILVFLYLILRNYYKLNTYREMFIAEISKKPHTTMVVKIQEPSVNLDVSCPLQ